MTARISLILKKRAVIDRTYSLLNNPPGSDTVDKTRERSTLPGPEPVKRPLALNRPCNRLYANTPMRTVWYKTDISGLRFQKPVELLFQDLIALTGRVRQGFAVQNGDMPAPVPDQARLLKGP